MKRVSIFNNVLGPIMRGPSSSHTAGSYHIGRMARDIFDCTGEGLESVLIEFDSNGSYAKVFREQGADNAFVAGIMDWDLLDDRFHDALPIAEREGVAISFAVGRYEAARHPNWARLTFRGRGGATTMVTALSIGGGSVSLTEVDGYRLDIRGNSWNTLVVCGDRGKAAREVLEPLGPLSPLQGEGGERLLLRTLTPPPPEVLLRLREMGIRAGTVRPIYYQIKGDRLFNSAENLRAYAAANDTTLGEAGLAYECELLGMTRAEALAEMSRRYGVMKASCKSALTGKLPTSMQILRPTAHRIFEAGETGRLPYFGMHTRAAVRAMAVMHANGGMDVVCAAPTGGSAGVVPAVAMTLEEELGLSPEDVALALFAAGAVGMVVDTRATFAAEVAGCQVEIGAAGAMAAAACVDAAGGGAWQALDAASISFQNTMGSICDPVQGAVELPCHTRNAAAAAAAFVNADLILGGYENPIPLDETIDAVLKVGEMLPMELRCTSLGGLSICPSALAMKRLR